MDKLRSGLDSVHLSPSASSASEGSVSARPSPPATPTPRLNMAPEKVVEAAKREAEEGKAALSLVVVGHVDAGKSTMMGRLLVLLGVLSAREHNQNERASSKLGKGSFAYAWALDSSEEERTRGVTIDVAQDTFETSRRHFTLLDAPGHRDFIPNMISGAAQADAALLVVDAGINSFESGFGPHGQTREHALLVRSLGVQQLIVVVNKMDAVQYDQGRYEYIVQEMKPFLIQTGFNTDKVQFVPCGATVGENLAEREPEGQLAQWYNGPTVVQVLDQLEPSVRHFDAPLRLPVTNVFKSQGALASGLGVSGRIVSGVVQVGEVVRAVPGDESGVVKTIEKDGEAVPWAGAGASVTLYLTGMDQINVNVGSVLCPPSALVPLATEVQAQVIVFEPTYPLVLGTALEVFHHSSNTPATLSELVATLDKSTGEVKRRKPRVLAHHSSAEVKLALHAGGATAGQSKGVPMEDVKANKEMARLLLRKDGETVAAGIVLNVFTEH